LLNRVAIPGMIVVFRMKESLRADRRALFALDMTAWYTCLGGMYGEVGTVIQMVGWEMYDDTVQHYEEDMWGSQPSQKFQEVVPNKVRRANCPLTYPRFRIKFQLQSET
jgi:hypothetical protein